MSAGMSPRLIVLALICAIPLVQYNSYWLHVFSLALIGAVLAMGLQLLVGKAGVLSLGQGAFYGIGAYTAGGLAVSWNLPFIAAVLIGGVSAAVASLLLIPIVRLKGSSLAVATLGFGIIVHVVMLNEDWLTGGSIGMMDIPAPSLLGMNFGAEAAFYYVCVTVAGFVYFALNRIAHSRFGRGLVAISQEGSSACQRHLRQRVQEQMLSGSRVYRGACGRALCLPLALPQSERFHFPQIDRYPHNGRHRRTRQPAGRRARRCHSRAGAGVAALFGRAEADPVRSAGHRAHGYGQ